MGSFSKIVSQYRIPHTHSGDSTSGGICYGNAQQETEECQNLIRKEEKEEWSTDRTDQGYCGTCGTQFQVYTSASYGCSAGHWHDWDGYTFCPNPSCSEYLKSQGLEHTHTVEVGSVCGRITSVTVYKLDCTYTDCGESDITYSKSGRAYSLSQSSTSENAGFTVSSVSWGGSSNPLSITSNGTYTVTVSGTDNKTGAEISFNQDVAITDYKLCPTIYYGTTPVEAVYYGTQDVTDCFYGTQPLA